MRTDIEFDAEGVTLRGWFYQPDTAGPHPVIVLAHGFAAVKEMCLDRFAERFAERGLASIVFDHRGFGASDGDPRQEIDPWLQVRDYRHAISYAQTQANVDAARVGVWGSSYSGGHALVVAAIDRRVKCVVSQVPLISGYRNIQRLVRPDMIAAYREQFAADRNARFRGNAAALVPVVAEDPLAPCVLPTRDAWQWFSDTQKRCAPAFRNEVTLRSVEMLMEYEPGMYVDRIGPTPLLMVVASQDAVAVTDEALLAYQRALEPKQLLLIEGGHFEAYDGAFQQSSTAAADWFAEHLKRK